MTYPGLNLLHIPARLKEQAGAGVAERVEETAERTFFLPSISTSTLKPASNEESALQRIEAARSERESLPEVGHEARARAAVAEHLLAERVRAASTAARLAPPGYIKSELASGRGTRRKRGSGTRRCKELRATGSRTAWWTDTRRSGRRPTIAAGSRQQAEARRRIERAQRLLNRTQQRAAERSVRLGIGR